MRAVVASLACALWAALPSVAYAGGLYFTERGVHNLGRAGAYVAGARGLSAVGINPAGIEGNGIYGDLTLPIARISHRRELAIDDADGNPQRVTSPSIEGTSDLIPFPTLVLVYTPERSAFSLAFGLVTPTFALLSYPDTVEGEPSPARYTLSGFTDSRLLMGGAWLSHRPTPWLSYGLGVHALAGTFRSSLSFSLSLPDRLLAAPEDPDYDAFGRVAVGPFVAPSGSAGLTLAPRDDLRIGVSAELPIWIDSASTFDVRLPSAATFDTVTIEGKSADVALRLPAILRAGIEYRPIAELALELAYVREFWSLHDRIEVSPRGVEIRGLVGGPEVIALPEITIDRSFVDSNAFRFGGEWSFSLLGLKAQARAGLAYETSAVPPAYLSLSSVDFDKVVVSLGGSLAVSESISLELAYAHYTLFGEDVSTREARLRRVQPLSGNVTPEVINAGRYRARADVLSAGFSYLFH
jgi:long-chain fatty acid transport protein